MNGPRALMRICMITAVPWCLATAAIAQEGAIEAAPAADESLESLIDRHIDARLTAEGIAPAAPATDEEFARRVHLDLIGRPPTRDELRAYVSTTEQAKRAALIDRLLAGEEFPRHLADQLNALLAGRTAFPMSPTWAAYLRGGIAGRRGWQALAREMILARPPADKPEDPTAGAVEFLARRYAGPEPLDVVTRDVTRLFFGVDMQCARCHMHPVVPEWEPVNYWGMASFFNRTYPVTIGGRTLLGERARGDVSYTTSEKQPQVAVVRFMTGDAPQPQPPAQPEDPRLLDRRQAANPQAQPGDPLLDNPEDYIVPPAADAAAPSLPLFSRRQALVDLALDEGNPYFARAIVNRVWSWMLGRGLVEPLDQMHVNNPGSHPELLTALAADFAAHGYDFQRLYRGLALSRAYGRDSRWPEGAPRPADDRFAVAAVRPLSTHDYAVCVLCAVGLFEAPGGRTPFEEAQAARIAEYIKLLDPNSDEFQPSLQLSLFLANSPQFDRLIAEGGLAARLTAIADDEELVRAAFESVLSRTPDAEELAQVRGHLAARADRRADAVRQIVWGLITASEFRFNH